MPSVPTLARTAAAERARPATPASANSWLRPPRPVSRRRVTVVSPDASTQSGTRRRPTQRQRARRRNARGRIARLAECRRVERLDVVASAPRPCAGAVPSRRGASRQARSRVAEPRIAWLDGLLAAPAHTCARCSTDRTRQSVRQAAAPHASSASPKSGRITDRRSRSDDRRDRLRPARGRRRSQTSSTRQRAAASRPPLIADRCLRTALSPRSRTPLCSSSRVAAILSCERRSRRRRCQHRRRAAGEQHDQPFAALPTVRRQPQRGPRRFDACLVGRRVRAAGDHDLADSSSPDLAACGSVSRPYAATNAAAIGRAALPAATTEKGRSRTGDGRQAALEKTSGVYGGKRGVDDGAKMAPQVAAKRNRKTLSVKVPRVRPARQAGDEIELPKQLAHHLVRVFLRAEVLELIQNSRDGAVGIGDRALGVVLTLPRKTLAVLEELLAIEVGQ